MLYVYQYSFNGFITTALKSDQPDLSDESTIENSIQVGTVVRNPAAAKSMMNAVCNVLESAGVAYTRCD